MGFIFELMSRVIVISILLFNVALVCPSYGQELDSLEVITRFFEAYGGEGNWRAVKTLGKSSTMKKYVNGVVANEIESLWIVKGNNKQKIHSKEDDELFGSTLCLNDTVFWRESDLGNIEVLPSDHMEYYKATMGFGDPLFYLREGMEINFLGVKNFLGTDYYAFRLKGKGWHLASIKYLDMNTFLIVYSHVENNTNMCCKKSEYKRINGLMFPFKEEYFNNGCSELESKTIINSLDINVPIADSVFDIPR